MTDHDRLVGVLFDVDGTLTPPICSDGWTKAPSTELNTD